MVTDKAESVTHPMSVYWHHAWPVTSTPSLLFPDSSAAMANRQLSPRTLFIDSSFQRKRWNWRFWKFIKRALEPSLNNPNYKFTVVFALAWGKDWLDVPTFTVTTWHKNTVSWLLMVRVGDGRYKSWHQVDENFRHYLIFFKRKGYNGIT